MNRAGKKCSPAAPQRKVRTKEKKSPRSPLKDLNSSSSISVEAPRGCFRFLLSNSTSKTSVPRSKSLPKTPKSAPNPTILHRKTEKIASNLRSKPPKKNAPRPTSENSHEAPSSQAPQKAKSSYLLHRQNGKRPISGVQLSEADPQSKAHMHQSFVETGTGKSAQLTFLTVLEENGTPLNKLASGNGLISTPDNALRGISTTPPLQSSVSPNLDLIKPSQVRYGPLFDISATPANKLSSMSSLVPTHDKEASEKHTSTTPDVSFRATLELNATPANKSTSGSCLVSTPDTTNTPPIQASISPEIICGSSLVSTPACFAAGYVVVGVSDKRKCRPRGILTVGEEVENLEFSNSRVSLVPVPAEASVRWHLSPSEESKKRAIENASPEVEGLMTHTVSVERTHGLSDDSIVRVSMVTSPTEASMNWLLSPSEGEVGDVNKESPMSGAVVVPTTSASDATPSSGHGFCSSSSFTAGFGSRVLMPQHKVNRYDQMVENSPLSVQSWGSCNVICTPVSDSSSDRQIGSSWMNPDDVLECQHNLDSVVEDLQAVNLSPGSQVGTCHPTDVSPLPPLSFQFLCPVTPSNSLDVTEALKPLHGQTFGMEEFCRWEKDTSSPNFEKMSQVRISWREGLISRIFEMDEMDCCEWLSDEEENVNYRRRDQFISYPEHELKSNERDSILNSQNDRPLADGFGSPQFLFDKQDEQKGKGKLPSPGPISCAESISTEGGGLVASGDSDWTAFYKNQLFEV